jgi:hypothetical protein
MGKGTGGGGLRILPHSMSLTLLKINRIHSFNSLLRLPIPNQGCVCLGQ